MNTIKLEIIKSVKNLLTEVVALLFTLTIFWSLYEHDMEKALIFSLLLIALQLEKIADKFKL